MENLNSWLFEQVPVVVVMGLVIWKLYLMYKAKDVQVTESTNKVYALAEKVVTVATLYEANKHKTNNDHAEIKSALDVIKNSKNHSEIKAILIEIKAIINSNKNN